MAGEEGNVKNYGDQIKNFWGGLKTSQKIFLIAVILITAILIFFMVKFAENTNYEVLFSNIAPEDSGAIIERLKNDKIPYRVNKTGSLIEVPSSKVGELRMSLAAAGLPSGGGVGFEIFDKTTLSTTDFVQNINYIRAKEGALARSIASLNEVIVAKVHITLPKDSVFIEKKEPAKASIVLKLRTGSNVTPNRGIIPAIIHLTAQSVEGLEPENIAIVDVRGRLLSKPRDNSSITADLNSSQIEYHKNLEELYKKKIKSQLEPIVGYGKVRAEVSLELDFNKVESTETRYDPEATAKISEQKESSKNIGAQRGGVPGVGSNVAQAEVKNNNVTTIPSRSESKSVTSNYEVSKKMTHIQSQVGAIKKISVSVTVDNINKTELKEGKLTKKSIPRSKKEMDTILKLVKASVGYNKERGDIIEVANLPFDTSMEIENEYYLKQEESKETKNKLIKYGSYLLGGLLLFFLILRPMYKKAFNIFQINDNVKLEELNIPSQEDEKKLQEMEDAEIDKELKEKYKISKEAKKISVIKNKVKEFADQNIDEATSLIKTYLMEDRE